MTSTCTAPAGRTADHATLIRDHLPLVQYLVRETLARVPAHVQRDELVSAGMFALASCAQSFDPDLNVGFAAYARVRIRGALLDELRAMDWASRSVRSRAREVEAARTRLTGELGATPAAADVARSLGITREEVDEVDHAANRATVISLQALSPEAGADTVVCGSAGPESLLLRREQFGELREAVTELPERLRFIIEQYFFGQRKMADIAAELGVTESRVSQLRSQALKDLRTRMQAMAGDTAEAVAVPAPHADARRIGLAARTTLARRLAATSLLAEPRRYAFAGAR